MVVAVGAEWKNLQHRVVVAAVVECWKARPCWAAMVEEGAVACPLVLHSLREVVAEASDGVAFPAAEVAVEETFLQVLREIVGAFVVVAWIFVGLPAFARLVNHVVLAAHGVVGHPPRFHPVLYLF